ncbi:hypothetical protein GCM10020254_05660 [Streptomyces goshikiensis]
MTTLHPTVEQAQALIDFERYDQALELLGRHLAEDPGDIRAWVKIGYSHLNTKAPRQASEAADQALQLDPEDYGALMLRAQAMVDDGGLAQRRTRTAPGDPGISRGVIPPVPCWRTPCGGPRSSNTPGQRERGR